MDYSKVNNDEVNERMQSVYCRKTQKANIQENSAIKRSMTIKIWKKWKKFYQEWYSRKPE